ncbi:MAG: helix-turn-helix domain-containing protein [Pirellulales bacterium]|nr:helix-turn-helix domain-containing protein [Pirellulales bacterium]
MAQKYYNVKQAAEILGLSEDDIKQMHANRELHGYRDGADWKFKVEDIDKLADQRNEESELAVPEEDEGDTLLSEVELGESDPGASGTVIGMEGDGRTGADSDIKLGDDSEVSSAVEANDLDSKVAQFEELDLTLEEDLSLADSSVQLSSEADDTSGGSGIELMDDALDDDDLVLGGSGTGSDITIGGDSGISLVDPADSGLSLEDPLDLAGSGTESLELGEDDMIAVEESEAANTESPTELKTDDDFLLTPLEEVADDDSESGSQVIALDTEGDEDGTMVADQAGTPAMAAMLDEDFSAEPADALGGGAPLAAATMGDDSLGVQPAGFVEGAPVAQVAATLPEAPYSAWNVLSLALCCILLVLCGMFMYDLMRNMWSWDTPYTVNSTLMDMILDLFG